MERLTEYDEFGNAEFIGIDNTKLYERLVCDETVALTIATNKLAEFEDFMEEQDFESLQLLKATLKMKTQSIKGFEKLYQENQALKDRWQNLKEWIKEQNNPIDNLVISDDETKYLYMSDILDEMQELEKE